MISITREHSICTGHRVYNQGGPCENLHGHEYIFYLSCSARELNSIGMVLDFSEIKKRLCGWLDDNWDHRFLIWEKDPWAIPLASIDPKVVWVPFNPTVENIATYLVTKIGPEVLEGTGVSLSSCKVFETKRCAAEFT